MMTEFYLINNILFASRVKYLQQYLLKEM